MIRRMVPPGTEGVPGEARALLAASSPLQASPARRDGGFFRSIVRRA